MAALATGATLLAIALGGCGSSDDDAGVDAQREQIARAFDDVQDSVEAGRAGEACRRLGAKAREQVAGVGHATFQTCGDGMKLLLGWLRKERRGKGFPASEVSDDPVELRAVATVRVDGRRMRLPFVMERGRWKLDSFYGMNPRLSVAVP